MVSAGNSQRNSPAVPECEEEFTDATVALKREVLHPMQVGIERSIFVKIHLREETDTGTDLSSLQLCQLGSSCLVCRIC